LGFNSLTGDCAVQNVLRAKDLRILDRTGEFRQRTQRRYDDTSLLVAEMCKWGYLEGRGKEALERMIGRTVITKS